MAFVDFSLAPAGVAPTREAPRADFSAVEWTVIRLARRDGRSTAREGSRLGAMLRRLFGLARPNLLADPRLEALRRAAVRCWHGDRRELDGLVVAGFRVEQVALLAAHVQVTRALAA